MSLKNYFSNMFSEHPGVMLGAIAGFVVALSLLIFGFLKTLFIVLFMLFGILVGKLFEDGALFPFIEKIKDKFRK